VILEVLTVALIKIWFFLDGRPCQLGQLDQKDGGTRLLRNITNYSKTPILYFVETT